MDINSLPGIGIKPLLSLKRHYRTSIVAGVVVVLLGLPVVWIKGQSSYVAEAIFQVSPTYMKNLESDKELELQSNSQYREYVNHLSNTVTRYDVLQRALNALKAEGIDTRPPALTERKYIEQLQKTVYVRAIPDTYMVRIGTEGRDKVHLDELVNAITTSFLETTKAEQIYGSSERLNTLRETAQQLRKDVAAMEAERMHLSEKLGLTSFGDNAQNPYDALLAQTRERHAVAEIDRWRAQAAYNTFISQREIPTDFAGRSLLEMRLQDNGLQALRNEVIKRIEQLNQVIAGLEDKHPARKPAVAEIKALTQRLQEQEAEFDRKTFENFRLRLVATLQQKVQVEQEIRKTLNQLEGQATEFATRFQQAMHLTKEIKERERRLQQIQDRLNYLDTERNALGFVRLVTPALPPETPMGLGKTKLLLGVIMAAFGLALAVPIGLDMLYPRIRSVNEAEKLLEIPSAGWQIRKEDLPTRLFAEEQTRRFVATLIRNRARSERHAFAFTSVKPGGGTTSIILDATRTLTNLGARVLIVEASAFAPFVGFDDLQPGLSDFLAGKTELAALPQTYVHQDCALQVVGIGTEHSSSLKRLDRLRQAVAEWSALYDYLLFDLPPILLSADAEMLVQIIGQVFLVVEAEAVTRGEVSRAKRLLQKIDPEAVGLFVNRVPLFRGGGYMEEVIVETLTREKFGHFKGVVNWKLQWELLRARWAMRRKGKREAPGADKAS
ncbi:MAG: hypothetical protein P9E88_04415 [Candidatus Competibacter sp.]|nr:hypothetical protein [Candidatus Competibacter sp.]